MIVFSRNIWEGQLCQWFLFNGYELKSYLRSDHRCFSRYHFGEPDLKLDQQQQQQQQQITAEPLTRPSGRNASGWRSETNRTFPGSILSLTTADAPFVLDVRRGLPSDSTATELNRKGLVLASRFSVPFFFLCATSLKGIVYPRAVKSTPRTGSISPKGAVRSSRLPSFCRRAFITFLYIQREV